jgi:hypothetical protein
LPRARIPDHLDGLREDVAQAALGLDQHRLGRVTLELPARAQDQHVDAPVIHLLIMAARGRQKLLAAEDLLRGAQHRPEKVELPAGEPQRLSFRRGQAASAHIHLPFQEAVAEIGSARGAAPLRRLGTAQGDPDAREQLPQAEGLGQVVVGTELQPDDLVDLLVAVAGDDDDGRGRRAAEATEFAAATLSAI